MLEALGARSAPFWDACHRYGCKTRAVEVPGEGVLLPSLLELYGASKPPQYHLTWADYLLKEINKRWKDEDPHIIYL